MSLGKILCGPIEVRSLLPSLHDDGNWCLWQFTNISIPNLSMKCFYVFFPTITCSHAAHYPLILTTALLKTTIILWPWPKHMFFYNSDNCRGKLNKILNPSCSILTFHFIFFSCFFTFLSVHQLELLLFFFSAYLSADIHMFLTFHLPLTAPWNVINVTVKQRYTKLNCNWTASKHLENTLAIMVTARLRKYRTYGLSDTC